MSEIEEIELDALELAVATLALLRGETGARRAALEMMLQTYLIKAAVERSWVLDRLELERAGR